MIGPILFQSTVRPIYNPLLFSSGGYTPSFDNQFMDPNSTLIFSMREVNDLCQNNWACKFDYIQTGVREIALTTLSLEQKFLGLKEKGSKLCKHRGNLFVIWTSAHFLFTSGVSCGALLRAWGAVKTPVGNNYLDGVTVTFTCRPEYFLHGDQQRTCRNGTWSPGWHVWCRSESILAVD